MLQPKRVKYRRPHGLSYEGKSKAGNEVSFGEFGLQALEGEYITARQIEAARIVLSRYTNRQGQVWIRIYPSHCKTKKPAQVRMVKVPQINGLQSLRLAELCLKLVEFQKQLHVKHYV